MSNLHLNFNPLIVIRIAKNFEIELNLRIENFIFLLKLNT